VCEAKGDSLGQKRPLKPIKQGGIEMGFFDEMIGAFEGHSDGADDLQPESGSLYGMSGSSLPIDFATIIAISPISPSTH